MYSKQGREEKKIKRNNNNSKKLNDNWKIVATEQHKSNEWNGKEKLSQIVNRVIFFTQTRELDDMKNESMILNNKYL